MENVGKQSTVLGSKSFSRIELSVGSVDLDQHSRGATLRGGSHGGHGGKQWPAAVVAASRPPDSTLRGVGWGAIKIYNVTGDRSIDLASYYVPFPAFLMPQH
jgi:hypothetical protein